MNFYFAGHVAEENREHQRKLHAHVLQSYAYDKKYIDEYIEHKKKGEWKGTLMIDSGAFTVHTKGKEVNVDEYIKYLNERSKYFDYAIQLDHIPGTWGKPKTQEDREVAPIKTFENYVYMLGKLKHPKKLLPVFHQHEPFEHLERFLTFTPRIEYICISGDKTLTPKERENWYKEVFNIIKNSKNPNIKTHCLGSATFKNAIDFPFTSLDATTWIMAAANGGIVTEKGTILVSNQQVHDRKYFRNSSESMVQYVSNLCKEYNIDIKGIESCYKQRRNFNASSLYHWSNKISYKEKSHNILKLF